jgi:hypothetical protein
MTRGNAMPAATGQGNRALAFLARRARLLWIIAQVVIGPGVMPQDGIAHEAPAW